MKMTVKEFYEWAKAHNVENAEVLIGYRDGGGYYLGYDEMDADEFEIQEDKQFITI